MKSFYAARSKVIHGMIRKDRQKQERELVGALPSGRELARRTLLALLACGPVNDISEWDEIEPEEPKGESGH